MTKVDVILGHDHQAGPKLLDRNLRVPETGKFFQVFHPWEQEKHRYLPVQSGPGFEQPRISIPSPVMLWGCRKGPTSDYQQIHPTWQERYFELYRFMVGPIPADGKVAYWYTGGEGSKPFKKVPAGTLHANPRFEDGTLLSAYSQVFEDHRASTDGAAYNTENGWYRDVVMKCHLDNPRTWRMKCLTWSGSAVEKHPNPPGPVAPGYTAIRVWDHNKPAPSLAVLLAPDAPPLWWGIDASPTKLLDGSGNPILKYGRPTYKASHYPYLKLVCRKYGLPEVGTPFFPIGIDGWNIVRNDDIHPLENGQSYSPYWPEK
jgi:hypothetical protein